MGIYQSSQWLMLRTPLLSSQIYEKLYVLNKSITNEALEMALLELLSQPEIEESLLVANPSLYESLKSESYKSSNKKKKQFFESLNKYIMRATTRPTPYGLFAGVGLLNIGEKTHLDVDLPSLLQKRCRVDASWLVPIAAQLEKDADVKVKLMLMTNPMALRRGDRLVLEHRSGFRSDRLTQSPCSVRYSAMVDYTLSQAERGIGYGQLLEDLSQLSGGVSTTTIETFLDQLIENEFLLSDLRPSNQSVDLLLELINKLKQVSPDHHLLTSLSDIHEQITLYNKAPLGSGIPLFLSLIEKMKVLHVNKDYIQTDALFDLSEASIQKEMIRGLETFMDWSIKLSSTIDRSSHLIEYTKKFLERYGYDQEVPLKKLFDEATGLGLPNYSAQSVWIGSAEKSSKTQVSFETFLRSRLMKALQQGDSRVQLTYKELEATFGKVEDGFTKAKPPASTELNVIFQTKSLEALQQGKVKIFIGPNGGSSCAGRSFGRFTHGLSEEQGVNIDGIKRKHRHEDVLYAEIVEVSEDVRRLNVSMNKHLEAYDFVISGAPNQSQGALAMEDLVIGADLNTNRLYCKSKRHQKQVIFTANHALYWENGSALYSFLRDISESATLSAGKFLCGHMLPKWSYIPRVEIENIVLYPETWKLSWQELLLSTPLSVIEESTSIEAFRNWRQSAKLPQEVYLVDHDHRLRLNLDSETHMNLLLNAFKKQPEKSLTLTEVDSSLTQSWLSVAGQPFIGECVIPFSLKHEFWNQHQAGYKAQMSRCQNLYERAGLKEDLESSLIDNTSGDSAWRSFELYMTERHADRFIATELLAFCESLKQMDGFLGCFYIQYKNPDLHIRLRVRLKDDIAFLEFLKEWGKWTQELKGKGLLKRVMMSEYEPETVRYGGQMAMPLAEILFCKDSEWSQFLLKMKQGQGAAEALEVLLIWSTLERLKICKIDQEALYLYLDARLDKKQERERFKANRKSYMSVMDPAFLSKEMPPQPEDLLALHLACMSALHDYWTQLEMQFADSWDVEDQLYYFLNLFHMLSNRLFGNSEIEKRVLCLLRHTLQSEQAKNKQMASFQMIEHSN